jgi:hypothetical protein
MFGTSQHRRVYVSRQAYPLETKTRCGERSQTPIYRHLIVREHNVMLVVVTV